jgi:hypothetical protein
LGSLLLASLGCLGVACEGQEPRSEGATSAGVGGGSSLPGGASFGGQAGLGGGEGGLSPAGLFPDDDGIPRRRPAPMRTTASMPTESPA